MRSSRSVRPLEAVAAPHVLSCCQRTGRMRSAGWRPVALVLAIVLCCCSPCVGFNCCTSDNSGLAGCSAAASPWNSDADCAAVNDLVLAFNTVLNPAIGACARVRAVGAWSQVARF